MANNALTFEGFSSFEPMRKNWFIIQITPETGNEDRGFNDLSVACHSCDIPKLTTNPNELHRINDIAYTPGKSQWNEITFSFYEYMKSEDNATKSAGQILYDWQKEIHNATTGKQGTKKEIGRTISIIQINADGSPVRTWNCYHAWPTDVNFDSLDATGGDVLSVSCTIRFDWAEMEV